LKEKAGRQSQLNFNETAVLVEPIFSKIRNKSASLAIERNKQRFGDIEAN